MSQPIILIDSINTLLDNEYLFFSMSNFDELFGVSSSESKSDGNEGSSGRQLATTSAGNIINISGINLTSLFIYIPEIFRKNTEDKSLTLTNEKTIRTILFRVVTTRYKKVDKSGLNKKQLRLLLNNKINQIDNSTFDYLYDFLVTNSQSYLTKMIKLILHTIESYNKYSQGLIIKPLRLHYLAQYYYFNTDTSTYNDIDEYINKYFALKNDFDQNIAVMLYRNYTKNAMLKWTSNNTATIVESDPTFSNFMYYVLDTLSIYYRFIFYYTQKTDNNTRTGNISIFTRKYKMTNKIKNILSQFHDDFSSNNIFKSGIEYTYVNSFN